ncbi:hypothetical protein [Kitasatospora sp. NPDC059327]|uniref:hypothetical protein n=1 Tax=Kitasatospora sp. NPDC059327 TaxID=3346803 RepID=UPI003675701B
MQDFPVVLVSSDIDADATLIVRNGRSFLVVNARQSFDSAVNAAHSVLRQDFPSMHPDEVRRVIRRALPDLADLNRRLGVGEAPPPVRTVRPERLSRPARSAPPAGRRVAVGKVLAAATIAALGVGVGWSVPRAATPAAPPAPNPTFTYANDPAFRQFAEAGQMRCTPIGPMQARCTDVDRLVMYSEAAVSPTSVAYSFSYGRERIFVMAFHTSADAREWAGEAGTRGALPHLILASRFVLWGSDAPRLEEYHQLIMQSVAQEQQSAEKAGLTLGMPERLGALAFGTLGISQTRVANAEVQPNGRMSGLLAAVRLVLGGDREKDGAPEVGALADGSLVAALLGSKAAPAPTSGTTAPSPFPESTPMPSSSAFDDSSTEVAPKESVPPRPATKPGPGPESPAGGPSPSPTLTPESASTSASSSMSPDGPPPGLDGQEPPPVVEGEKSPPTSPAPEPTPPGPSTVPTPVPTSPPDPLPTPEGSPSPRPGPTGSATATSSTTPAMAATPAPGAASSKGAGAEEAER